MSEAQREMTLGEWVDRLPTDHAARAELTRLRQRVEELERVLNNTRADAQYRVSSLTTERDEARKDAKVLATYCRQHLVPDDVTALKGEYLTGYAALTHHAKGGDA